MSGLLKKGGRGRGSDRFTDLDFFGGGGEGGAWQKEVRSIFQGGADTLGDTMMDFWKVIYENVEKEHSFHNNHIYIYRSQTL